MYLTTASTPLQRGGKSFSSRKNTPMTFTMLLISLLMSSATLVLGYRIGWVRGERKGYAKGFTDGMAPVRRTPPPSMHTHHIRSKARELTK
jgi:hypothetical protein